MRHKSFTIVLTLLALVVAACGNQCGPHEVPTDCYNACGTLCSQQGGIINCPKETCGTKGCFCEKGYARATTADSCCVPISKCPKTANN